MYKYFKDNEIVNLKPELVKKLDLARELAGIPFIIQSGYRTLEENFRVKGVSNSAHRTGEAVDLFCTNSRDRIKIVEALLEMGFRRIGIGKSHIHCDISYTLPQDVLFLEYA